MLRGDKRAGRRRGGGGGIGRRLTEGEKGIPYSMCALCIRGKMKLLRARRVIASSFLAAREYKGAMGGGFGSCDPASVSFIGCAAIEPLSLSVQANIARLLRSWFRAP